MPEDATAQRKRRVFAHYDKNLDGKLVRKSAFRECDYTPEGHLWEFDTEDAVQAFEKARYEDGTLSMMPLERRFKQMVRPHARSSAKSAPIN